MNAEPERGEYDELAEPDYAMHSTSKLLDLYDGIRTSGGIVPTDLHASLVERGIDLSAPRTSHISY